MLAMHCGHAGARLHRGRPLNSVVSSQIMSIAKVALTLLLVVNAMSNAAEGAHSNTKGCPPSGAKVFVSSAGRVTLNEVVVAAGDLGGAIKKLNPPPTVICYARENPEREPHPQALVALEAVMSARLPIALFKDSTFSETVSP